VDSFWVHLDFDVLSDQVMPAVDYRMADGLNSGELVNVLRRAIKTGKAVGMSIAIFNPTLDWDGSLAAKIVEIMRAGLI
jgi:arginase